MIIYVDFQKAFDSVNGKEIMELLKMYNAPLRLLRSKSKLCENKRARVVTTNEEIEYFELTVGILQKYTLAPYLLAIVMDKALHQKHSGRRLEQVFQMEMKESSKNKVIKITNLHFADNLTLLTEELDQAQEVVRRLENEAKRLVYSAKQTEAKIQVANRS